MFLSLVFSSEGIPVFLKIFSYLLKKLPDVLVIELYDALTDSYY